MRLRPQLFPHQIERRRERAGYRNEHGEFVPGTVETVTLRASVQPVELEDIEAEGGNRLTERIKVFVAEENALRPAFEDARGDEFRVARLEGYAGKTYRVEQSRLWPGGYTRVIAIRET